MKKSMNPIKFLFFAATGLAAGIACMTGFSKLVPDATPAAWMARLFVSGGIDWEAWSLFGSLVVMPVLTSLLLGWFGEGPIPYLASPFVSVLVGAIGTVITCIAGAVITAFANGQGFMVIGYLAIGAIAVAALSAPTFFVVTLVVHD